MTTRCYGIDGTPYATFDRYIPCNATAAATGGHTACCAPGDNCLSNGFCQSQADNARKANLFWRNGCTDPSWNDPSCPKFCESTGKPDTHAVFYCLQSNSWCCPDGPFNVGQTVNTTCCTISNLVFTAADPAIYTIAEINMMSTVSTARPTSSVRTQISSIAFATSGTSAASQPSQSSDGASGSSTTSSQTSDNKMGIYVGVPLGILLAIALAVIAWLAIQNRKLKKANQPQQQQVQYPAPYYQPGKSVAEMRMRPEEMAGQEVASEMPDSDRWRGHQY